MIVEKEEYQEERLRNGTKKMKWVTWVNITMSYEKP